MIKSPTSDLRERIEKFLRGSRCLSRGQPPIDELMQKWLDGVLSDDPAASDRLRVAIEFSLARVAAADARAPLSGPELDAHWCATRQEGGDSKGHPTRDTNRLTLRVEGRCPRCPI